MAPFKPRVLNKRTDAVPKWAIYVGRPSKWGNPFKVEDHGREGAIQRFKDWLLCDPNSPLDDIAALRGFHLVCWCAPEPCHADFLLEIANKRQPRESQYGVVRNV